MIAKTFLRLERDFDKHVKYYQNEPQAQEFLATNVECQNYFQVSFLTNYIHFEHIKPALSVFLSIFSKSN